MRKEGEGGEERGDDEKRMGGRGRRGRKEKKEQEQEQEKEKEGEKRNRKKRKWRKTEGGGSYEEG